MFLPLLAGDAKSETLYGVCPALSLVNLEGMSHTGWLGFGSVQSLLINEARTLNKATEVAGSIAAMWDLAEPLLNVIEAVEMSMLSVPPHGTALGSGLRVGRKITLSAAKSLSWFKQLARKYGDDWAEAMVVKYGDGAKVLVGPKGGLSIPRSKLQHTFKHAADFGVTGKWNKANGTRLETAINNHIADKSTNVITGTYHKQPATHYFNPSTGLNVVKDANGNLVTGWKLNPQQVHHVTTTGNLGGG